MGTPNFWTVLVILLFSICHQTLAAPYTKYGRSCSDIGCLPSEVCVMSQEACSFGQRDGKECGRFPTCKKGGAVPPTDNVFDQNPNTNTYDPPTTKKPAYSGGGSSIYPSVPSSNSGGGGGQPAYNPGYNPGGYNPGSYNPGGSSFGGSSYGGSDPYSPPRRTTTTTRAPTRYGSGGSSSSSGGSSFGGFFNGLRNALSGQVGVLIQNALTGKGGGFLDTRQLIQNTRGGSLFSENTNSGARTNSPTAAPGRANYPTQPPARANYPTQPSYTNNYQAGRTNQATTPKIGWNF